MTFLVGLLPVRNGAADLPLYLRHAERYMDAVVALDDGSTDGTGEILRAAPLVRRRLSNPRRDGYAGWDDAANRSRLLAAAQALRPKWIISVDADELLDDGDALALRRFLAERGLPGVAYGLQRFRMISDLETYDKDNLWCYRVFAAASGQTFPQRRLHFEPIPTDIPGDRWIRTRVRIKHRAGLTAEQRRARFAKYLEADPDNSFQDSYANLLDPPGALKRWSPTVPDRDILLDAEHHAALGRLAAARRPGLLRRLVLRRLKALGRR